MIYHNAYVFTIDRRFEYGSFCVREGCFAPVEDAAEEEKFDLQGGFVIPGLIDIHTHGSAGAGHTMRGTALPPLYPPL